MSGGVDSAVALLAAGANAVGVTLRLWIDPRGAGRRARLLLAGRGDRGARDLPRARAPARDARPARGVPPHGRRAVHRAATRAARRRTRASAATAASASTSCSRSPIGSAPRGSRPATTRASSSATAAPAIARAADPRKDQSYMLATRRPAALGRLWFPLGGQTKEQTRARGRRPPASPPRRQRREPGGVLPRRRRLPRVPRAARARRRHRARRRRERAPARQPRRLLALHARPAPRARHRRVRAALRARHRRPDEHRRRRPASVARPDDAISVRGPPRRAARAGSRRSSATARPRSRRPSTATAGGFELRLDEPAYGVAPGQTAVLYADDAVVGAGVVTSATAD